MNNLVPIADVLADAEVFTDGDWVESKDQVPSGDVRLTQLADVGDGYWIDKSARFLTPEKAEQLRCTYLEPGDLLVARMPDPLGRCCIFPGDPMPCVTVVDVCVIRPNQQKTNNRYLMHVINSPHGRRGITRYITGTTRLRVSRKNLGKVEIPLPPLAEQKRIAQILDAADALRAKRRESIAQLDMLLQSTFLDMFGDPVTNPMGWGRKLLGEITTIDAAMVDPTEDQYRDLLHYGPDRIEKETGKLLPAMTAEEDELISGKFLCTPGEILYSKIRPYLNKVALVKEPCLCSADVYPVAPLPEFMSREYLWLLLRSQGFMDYVARFSNRANIPKLNRKQFAGYAAPIPPLDLQHRFTAIVESVEQQKNRQREHLAELDRLFASLQSLAFKGEL